VYTLRWIEHWIIGKDAFAPRRSLPYQLGTVLPDWFERQPIHRWQETRELFLDRAQKISAMPPGIRRDWYLGTLAHYLCDYCCMAHNEEYYRYYRHRVFEVQSQKYFLRVRKNRKNDIYQLEKSNLPAPYETSGDIREDVSRLIESYTGKLHERIGVLGSECWFRDHRIMALDIRYAYGLVAAVNELLTRKKV
jgi:hypothetical protein